MLFSAVRSHTLRCAGVAFALLAVAAVTGRPAQAQTPADAQATELAVLEQQLEDDLASCAADDCTVACQALESMIRSAERICAIEPGPRCDEARNKVATAKRRVRPRCPDCAAANGEEKQPLPAEPADEPELEAGEYGDGAPAGPPPADQGAGCAACTLGRRDGSSGMAWLLLAALAVLRRRRRRACGE